MSWLVVDVICSRSNYPDGSKVMVVIMVVVVTVEVES